MTKHGLTPIGGAGIGAMAGIGVSTTTTIATPTMGEMYNGVIDAVSQIFNGMGF